MTKTVILPKELEDRLDKLAVLTDEVHGILFYRPTLTGDLCPVEYLFLTGTGTEGSVVSIDERIEIANEFFKVHPEYKYIEFHTHSTGTIQRFGEHYATHFSEGDLANIRARLDEDQNYIAMLVTPKTKLVAGNSAIASKVIADKDFPDYDAKKRAIDEEITRIARTKGYVIGNLYVH